MKFSQMSLLSARFGRCACVLRSVYVFTSVGVRVYFGRCACVLRSVRDDNRAFFMKL